MNKIFFLKALENRNGQNGGSACIQLSKDTVIDAGNLLSLNQEELLENIFITHSHLDHILDLPFYIDANFTKFKKPIKIYGGKESIKALKEHIFNGKIWPDFHNIPLLNANQKVIEFVQLYEYKNIKIKDITITPVKSSHTIECYGLIIKKGENSIYFTSDTKSSAKLWDTINEREDIKQVILDIAFPSRLEQLANASMHMTPKIVHEGKKNLNRNVIIHAFHVKSTFKDEIIKEIEEYGVLEDDGKILKDGTSVYFDPKIQAQTTIFLSESEILETIFNTTSKISKEIDFENALILLANMVKTMLTAKRCTLWIIDREKNHIWTKVAHGLQESVTVPMNSGIVGKTIKEKKPFIINDPYSHPDFNKDVDLKTSFKTESIITVPIYSSQDEIIGVYQALNKLSSVDYSFDKSDIKYLQLASTFTGQIYESMLLNKELESTQKEIIYTLASVCESRSKETGNHVKRVALYSKLLAQKLGFDEKYAKLIELGSTTHDIGKVGIPDAILNKPGRFDDSEREIMQTHSAIGHEMLRHSKRPILKTAAIIANGHHEKWDGSGYPKGLKGENIDISARIVALADVFDALGSDRVYKKAWELDRILSLLKDERGKHFDPKLVDIFLDNLDEFLKIRNKYQDEFDL